MVSTQQAERASRDNSRTYVSITLKGLFKDQPLVVAVREEDVEDFTFDFTKALSLMNCRMGFGMTNENMEKRVIGVAFGLSKTSLATGVKAANVAELISAVEAEVKRIRSPAPSRQIH
ncbi:hypothetical protein KW785_03285 [Candidatus Parcubacteria bacterium]|nr:hypothetical protein [Candidatus Parcubacteria bacterium]